MAPPLHSGGPARDFHPDSPVEQVGKRPACIPVRFACGESIARSPPGFKRKRRGTGETGFVRHLPPRRSAQKRGCDHLTSSETADKRMRHRIDTQGGIVKGGGYDPLHVQSMQKWERFRKFPFSRLKLSTRCRQLEARRFQIAGPCLYGAVFHSTVTDLARFLGLSMSQPFSFAA